MNTKYRYKQVDPVEAIQFTRTVEGVSAIAMFAGKDFKGVDAKGAIVDGTTVADGQWLLRNGAGMYRAISENAFSTLYEPVPAVPAPAMVETVDAGEVLRSLARASGKVRYRPGKPCYNGHNAERYTNCNSCVVCSKESADRSKARLRRKEKAAEKAAQKAKPSSKGVMPTGIFAPLYLPQGSRA